MPATAAPELPAAHRSQKDDEHDKKISILAVDDHPLLREGIAAVIQDERDIVLSTRPAMAWKQSTSSAPIVPM